jgi:hypothetical protein
MPATDTPSPAAGTTIEAGSCPVVRPYADGDEHALVALLGAPFNDAAGLAHWRWKLRHWPSTAANVWLATSGGKAVFHYGGIPLRCSLAGTAATAMISVDAMTAPEFRRRGLLTHGAGRAFAEWHAHGIAFTLGLPNERWGSRTAAAGWQRLFPLRWLVQPLRPEVFAARRLGMPWLRRVKILSHLWRGLSRTRLGLDPQIDFRAVAQADGCFDSLWERCKGDAVFSAVRDSAWVQWRFLSSPLRKHDVAVAYRHGVAVGYRAIHVARTQTKTSAFLAEILAPDDDRGARDSLIADAIATAYDAGADVLAALAVPGTPVYSSLRGAGFLRGPAFDVHVVRFAAELSMEQLRNPKNWRLSGAEFDVI